LKYSIYAESNPDQHLQSTINDLVTCLRRATQAKVKLEDAPGSETESGIWVGSTSAAERFWDRIEELDHDGYLLWGNGSKLVISGRTPYGTSNGVYSFIHRFLGVRWFAPGPLFEFVPNLESFRLPKIVEFTKPSFPLRMYSGADREWCRRNLLDEQRPSLPFSSFSHNLTRIYPSSLYSEEYPGLYALRDGKRMTEQTSHRGQPCFSNNRGIEIAIRTIREYFEENPDAAMFSVSVNDNMDFCECDECSRYGVRRYRGRPVYSNVYFSWVAEVARGVLKSHPDKLIGALAYWGVVLPPEGIDELPPNVVIVLTQDTSQYHDSSYEKEDRRILKQWTEKCTNLVKYDYYGLGWLTPRFFPELASRDLDFLRKSGVVGFYCEAYPFWANFGPQLYMAAQKAWNVSRDHRELLDEYYGFFSPVSEEISSFYEVLEKSWLNKRPGNWFEGLGEIADELGVMTLEDANRAMEFLNTALEHSSGNCRKRVDFIRHGFEFSYQLIKGHHTSSELRFLPVSEQSDIDGALPLLSQIHESKLVAEEIHRDAIIPDELFPDVYFKDHRFHRKFGAWKGMLNSTCMVWMERTFEYLGRDMKAWDGIIAELPDALRRQARIIPHLGEDPNLISDPGFETMDSPPEATPEPAVGRWELRGEDCTCGIEESFARSGTRSLTLEGKGRTRLSIYLPVKAGGRYVVAAWVYGEPMERRRMPKMDITLLENADKMPGKPFSSDLLYASGEWQRLFSIVEVGEGIELMGVHLVINNDADRIWIDDVSVRVVAGGI